METLSEILQIDYPKDFTDNIKYRVELVKECEVNPSLRKDVIEVCKKNILFYINTFCWTKDPRKPLEILPYITYPFQDEHILSVKQAIDYQYDILNEKSRDMGVSWDILYAFTWFWLFEPGSDFRVGSRKEEYVDKLNDIDTLLEKVRFNLKRHPSWLLPEGFDFDKHAGYMRIVNPKNENAIVGESANPFFGSGGRRKAILLDEFAKWEIKVAEAAWTATADVTKCRVVVSTPVGSANKFALLAKGTKEKILKSTLHWTLHPEKAKDAYYLSGNTKVPLESPKKAFEAYKKHIKVRSPWYDGESERRSEADLAQEVDIDYLKSGRPYFNLEAIDEQKEWQYFKRQRPSNSIPYGYYITVNLVEIDNEIELRENITGWLRIYELPQEGYQYTLGGDTSEGLAKGDEAYGVIREKFTRNIVADFNGLYPPDDFAIKLQKAGKFYNNAKVAPENNNHGYSVCQDLKEMDCDLYYSTKINDKDGKETVTKAGFTTTTQSRAEMLDQFAEEIRKKAIEIRSPTILAQCKTFVHNAKTGKAEADGEFLDDGVIATAISGYVLKKIPYKPKKQEEKKIRQKRRVEELTKPIMRFKNG